MTLLKSNKGVIIYPIDAEISKINYITGEFHFEQEKKDELNDWISNTHN